MCGVLTGGGGALPRSPTLRSPGTSFIKVTHHPVLMGDRLRTSSGRALTLSLGFDCIRWGGDNLRRTRYEHGFCILYRDQPPSFYGPAKFLERSVTIISDDQGGSIEIHLIILIDHEILYLPHMKPVGSPIGYELITLELELFIRCGSTWHPSFSSVGPFPRDRKQRTIPYHRQRTIKS
jgi:hypothetical protein